MAKYPRAVSQFRDWVVDDAACRDHFAGAANASEFSTAPRQGQLALILNGLWTKFSLVWRA